MSQINPTNSIPPLNIGNVVSAGIVLYRSHLKSYMGVALRSVLWSFLPFLVALPIAGLMFYLFESTGRVPGILWLLVPVWIVFAFFCFAKYLLHSALLARLSFRELSSQPETVREARSHLNSRLWSFFILACLIGVLLFLVYMGLGIIAGVASVIIALVLSNLVGETAAVVIMTIFIIVGMVLGLTWFFSRWFVAEVVLAVEDGVDPGRSVSRSWELTETSVFRVQGVVFITFLVTLPLLALTNYIPSIALTQIEPLSPLYFLVYSGSLVASFLGVIVLLPLWQTVKSVLYYDLRNRREGLGLQLRDS